MALYKNYISFQVTFQRQTEPCNGIAYYQDGSASYQRK